MFILRGLRHASTAPSSPWRSSGSSLSLGRIISGYFYQFRQLNKSIYHTSVMSHLRHLIFIITLPILIGLNVIWGASEITTPIGDYFTECYIQNCAPTPALSAFRVGLSFFLWVAAYAWLFRKNWKQLALIVPLLFIIWVVCVEVLITYAPLPAIIENPWEGYIWVSDTIYFVNYTPQQTGGWPTYALVLILFHAVTGTTFGAFIQSILHNHPDTDTGITTK